MRSQSLAQLVEVVFELVQLAIYVLLGILPILVAYAGEIADLCVHRVSVLHEATKVGVELRLLGARQLRALRLQLLGTSIELRQALAGLRAEVAPVLCDVLL